MKNENKKVDLEFLDGMGFDDNFVLEINQRIPKETIDILNENKETVKANILYLKNLSINNYQDAFLRFYNMFLIEPSSFEDIFSKYDKDDLIVKLEKNIAIMEHL